MSIRILFSVLRRHSLMPALVMLQVAMACAILCNVLFLLWHQAQPMLAPSGVVGSELILVDQLSSSGAPWNAAQVRASEVMLRAVPGVRAATAATGLPMVSAEIYVLALQGPTGVRAGVNAYAGDGLPQTLGVDLVAGRDFLADEYLDGGERTAAVRPIILTRSLAQKLFPQGGALGGVLTNAGGTTDHGYRVVGIVRHLLRNQLGWAVDGKADNTVMLAERVGNTSSLSFAVRVDPAMQTAAIRGVRKAIDRRFASQLQSGVPPQIRSYEERRDALFRTRRAAVWLLVGVTLTVVVVTFIGIMGLTGFWVQRRTRQIGIRRALGGKRSDILRYFMAENALIVAAGVIIGMALAYLGNALLMREYELARLPWTWLPIGALVMLVLGQLAVLSPARRAAAVPPVVATRSV